MTQRQPLARFIEEGLRAGHSADELRKALISAGWSAREIETVLALWGDGGLRLPVPRPQHSVSGRDILLYGLMGVALLFVTWHLVSLGFALIDRWLPDPLHDHIPNAESMRWSIAVLIVSLPLFLWLNHRAEAAARNDPGARKAPVRHGFGSVALFLSALVLLGSAVMVVHAGLGGALTLAFVAKSALVMIVALVVLLWGRSFLQSV